MSELLVLLAKEAVALRGEFQDAIGRLRWAEGTLGLGLALFTRWTLLEFIALLLVAIPFPITTVLVAAFALAMALLLMIALLRMLPLIMSGLLMARDMSWSFGLAIAGRLTGGFDDGSRLSLRQAFANRWRTGLGNKNHFSNNRFADRWPCDGGTLNYDFRDGMMDGRLSLWS